MKPTKELEEFVDECEDAYINPRCPYVTQINKHTDDLGEVKTNMSEVKTNVEWLKKGYWIQTLLSLGATLTAIGLIIWVITGGKSPLI